VEHIIPQAIGGRLKARLYCKECNGIFGEALDDEISKQFDWVGTILNIKRERGKVQPYEVTDVKSGIKLLCDGKELKRKDPIVKVVSKDGKKLDSADVTARTEEELNTICASIKGRYDVPDGIKAFQDERPGPTDTEHIMMIDNSLLRRAVSKIAYGFLCIKLPKNVVFSSSFDAVRLYLREPNNINLASANYINTCFMTDYVRPIHKIHVAFNKGQGILIGFVSFSVSTALRFCYQRDSKADLNGQASIILSIQYGRKKFWEMTISERLGLQRKTSFAQNIRRS